MPCYSPGRSKQGQVVSCGGCDWCRLKYAGEWAVRCVHESTLYRENCFITLTYDDKRLPKFYDLREGLIYSHFQIDFLKALRDRCGGLTKVSHHKFGRVNGKTGEPYPEFHRPIRFYVSGEYGELRARPHWHALLFNFDFSDKYFWRWRRFPNGVKYPVYRSPTLDGMFPGTNRRDYSITPLWPYGNSEIGSVTLQSAGYCARYIMKKIRTKDEDLYRKHYRIVDDVTGQIFDRRPEFCKMSTSPGIGAGWFSKFHSDVFPLDRVVLKDGREVKPPRYYDKQYFRMTKETLPVCPFYDSATGEIFEDEVSPLLDNVKFDRQVAVRAKLDNPNRPSLYSEMLVHSARVSKLKRTLG